MQTAYLLILGCLVNALWQIPLVSAAAWLAARGARSIGVAAEHRIWVSALLLQLMLPVLSLMLPSAWLRFSWLSSAASAEVTVSMHAGSMIGGEHAAGKLPALVVSAYLLATAYFVVRFLRSYGALVRLKRASSPLVLTGDAVACWKSYLGSLGKPEVFLAVSERLFSPVTFGITGKLLILPRHMLQDLSIEAMSALFAHECAHIARNDFAKNLVYQALSLPVRWHPLLGLTLKRIASTREMICDRHAAERIGPHLYARSLLRLASMLMTKKVARLHHAIGFLDANPLERRLMSILANKANITAKRRAATLAGCIALGIVVCASALALRPGLGAMPAPGSAAPIKADEPVAISTETLAGNALEHAAPKYPEAAKKAKIQGAVLLDVIVGKDGAVEHISLRSGPEQLAPSALDAVSRWTYKPFLVNGSPVEVQAAVTVTYTLAK